MSTGTIVGWESGKFKPRGNKVAELSDLDNWDKADAEKVMEAKETKEATTEKTKEKKLAGTPQAEKVEAKVPRNGRQVSRGKKVIRRGKGKK